MRPDERTHDRNDQNRNLRTNQQDRYSGRGRDQSFRDDDRGLMDRAGDAMDRAGDAVRSGFGGDENQDPNRGDYRNQDHDFGSFGQDGDEYRRSQQGHNVGYSGQGYQGGMGNYAHGNQGQLSNPQYGQSGMSSQYDQRGMNQYDQRGMSQYGQGGHSQYGQGGMSSQYDQRGMGSQSGQRGMSSQYGQGQSGQYGQSQRSQYGQGQYGQYGQYGQSHTGSQYGQGNAGRHEGTGQSQYSGQSRQGDTSRGPHVGRGPRGYKRSDERLTEEINEKLTQHPDINAEEIEVKVQSGEVTLTGTVEDRQTKRMIEDLVEDISGVNDLHNQLRVIRNRGSMSQGSTAQGSHPQSSQSGLSGSQGAQLGSSSSMTGANKGEHSSAGSTDKSRTTKPAS